AGLSAFAELSLPPLIESRISAVNPAALALVGVAAAWMNLLIAPGHRRAPMWTAAALGTAVVLWTVGAPVVGLPPQAARFHDGVGVFTGLALLCIARAVMRLTRVNTRRFAVGVTAATAAVLFLQPLVPEMSAIEEKPLSYRGELNLLASLLEPQNRDYEDEVEPYIEEVARDEELDWEEQKRRMEELNERIAELEGDLERFEQSREENEQYEQEIARLQERVDELQRSGPAAEDLEKVQTYREAVRPSVPLVRDFAVELAAEHSGPYHQSSDMQMPGATGVKQIAAIHRYASAQWKYVNDPVVSASDYYSAADRTVASGLAGDCDDFAVLMASAVEAVGGRARIMHGSCADGGHAWAEAYIGDKAAWETATQILKRTYPGRRIEFLDPRTDDDYWLSLDWKIGTYSCGESPSVHYESP
ncbi:MAG: transglutaminase domain-containing protein, partial [Spirochaetia bacterium]